MLPRRLIPLRMAVPSQGKALLASPDALQRQEPSPVVSTVLPESVAEQIDRGRRRIDGPAGPRRMVSTGGLLHKHDRG